MESRRRYFACTQCGSCCDRSPEVQLSEAASLADVFVFRLMFRLYWLANRPDAGKPEGSSTSGSAAYYEKKRLLERFAARKFAAKVRRQDKIVHYTKYLMISALTVDAEMGACAALSGKQCAIYERRPSGCRSVPFHYSRGESVAEQALHTFVETPGYLCDTSPSAVLVLANGRIVDSNVKAARAEAAALTDNDRQWRQAIVKRMGAAAQTAQSLPSVQDVEANAQFGASTVSMGVAWRIARDMGLIGPGEYRRLLDLQLRLIGHWLREARCSNETRQTLAEIAVEYRSDLHGAPALATSN